jgi:hypothetical protein
MCLYPHRALATDRPVSRPSRSSSYCHPMHRDEPARRAVLHLRIDSSRVGGAPGLFDFQRLGHVPLSFGVRANVGIRISEFTRSD